MDTINLQTASLEDSQKEISENDKRRLRLGNLDPRISEFQLVKLLQKYGPLEKFDIIYHKAGDLVGHPRGFAFVTFKEVVDAKMFMQMMDGKLVGTRPLSVKLAYTIHKDDYDKPVVDVNIPVLAGAKEIKKPSREAQIKLIEGKLKKMAENSDDLASTSCQPIFDYRYNLTTKKTQKSTKHVAYRRNFKPYNRRL